MANYLTNEHEYRYRETIAGVPQSYTAWTSIGSKPVTLPNVNIAIGDLEVRVKALGGNNAGNVLTNAVAFTVAPGGGGGSDTDATTYFTDVEATGATLTTTQKDAWADFVTREKAGGRYDKYLGLYPILGGTQAAHSVNAKTPGTGNLDFTGTWSHTSDGMKLTDAVMGNSIALSGFIAGKDSNAEGVYINEDLGTNGYDFGAAGVSSYTDMGRFGATQYFHNSATPDHSVAVVDDIKGVQLITRTNSTEFHHVGRGTVTTFSQTSNSETSVMGFGGINGLSASSQRRYSFCFISTGLTTSEAQGLTDSLNTLQTDLSRA